MNAVSQHPRSLTTHTLSSALWLAMIIFAPVQAHHSVAAVYDTTRTVTIDGEIRELTLASPHSHLTISVLEADGNQRLWQTDMSSVGSLYRAGWTSKSLTIGEHVRVTGSPSRENPLQLYVISVIKADGTRLSTLRSQKDN
jgi:hypothetical protein